MPGRVVVVRRKRWMRWSSLITAALLFLLSGWAYWQGWRVAPAAEDAAVRRMLSSPLLSTGERASLQRWPGFLEASRAARSRVDQIAWLYHAPGWIPSPEVLGQQNMCIVTAQLAAFLGLVTAWLWSGVAKTTENGLKLPWRRLIPWSAITQIDDHSLAHEGVRVLTFVNRRGRPRRIEISTRGWDGLAGLLSSLDSRVAKAHTSAMVPSSAGSTDRAAATFDLEL